MSNICTAQVLLAVMASMYAVYHGPKGLQDIASRVHALTALLAAGLEAGGAELESETFFDTLTIRSGDQTDRLMAAALAAGYNIRRVDAGRVAKQRVDTLLDGVGFEQTIIAQTFSCHPQQRQ